MEKKQPVKKFRLGLIKAAIWINSSEKGRTWHNVTVSRLYKDGDDWKESSSFGRDDLPVVGKVLDQAHTWIFENANKAPEADSSE